MKNYKDTEKKYSKFQNEQKKKFFKNNMRRKIIENFDMRILKIIPKNIFFY